MVDGNKFKFKYFGMYKEGIWFCSLLGMTTGASTLIGAVVRNLIFRIKPTHNKTAYKFACYLNNMI